MLTPETLRRIRRIQLHTRKLVNTSFAGAYHAVFKGRGIAFDSVRLYEPGDDIRDIDWNVTARAGQAFIKRYVEEREMTVMLLLDSSASNLFGTQNQQKRDLAAELGAVLAYAAINNNDKVGLLIFSDKIELFISPRKGRNHILRLIRDLLALQPDNKRTDLSLPLKTVNRVIKGRAVIFLLSDFLAPIKSYRHDLLALSRRHDVIAITLGDPLEKILPNIGMITLRDAETDELITIDSTSSMLREQFLQQNLNRLKSRDTVLVRAGIDFIDIQPGGDYVSALNKFFQRRIHHLAR